MSAVLILRHAAHRTGFYDPVLDWMKRRAPGIAAAFRAALYPLPEQLAAGGTAWPPDLAGVRVVVPWLQDPVQAWSRPTYAIAMDFAGHCDRLGIVTLNRVERLTNATKSVAPALIAAAGLRTPRTVAIADPAAFRRDLCGLAPPLVVREDWGHGMGFALADSAAEARAIPLERFARPVACERIDVRDARDGLFRKYRYFAAGAAGISQHLQVSADWITRGGTRLLDDATRAAELAYIAAPDPHHARFQAARAALKLDMVAFDYGYDRAGDVVVWEANPFPRLDFDQPGTRYRNLALHRTVAAMLKLYLDAAGLGVPELIARLTAYDGTDWSADPRFAA